MDRLYNEFGNLDLSQRPGQPVNLLPEPEPEKQRGYFRALAAKFGLGAPLSDSERRALRDASGGIDTPGGAAGAFSRSYQTQEAEARNAAAKAQADELAAYEREQAEREFQLRLREDQRLQQSHEQDLDLDAIKEVSDGVYFNMKTRETFTADPAMMRRAAALQKASGKNKETFSTNPLIGYDEEGNPVGYQFGNQGSMNTVRLPEGFVRAQDSGLGKYNSTLSKADADAFNEVQEQASEYQNDVQGLRAVRQLVQNNREALGPGALKALMRGSVGASGVEIAGLSPEERDTLTRAVNNDQLGKAAMLAGQGPITDNERAMIARTVPNMSTDPDSWLDYIDTLVRVGDRQMDIISDYEHALQNGDYRGSYRSFQRKWMQDNVQDTGTDSPEDREAFLERILNERK